MNDEKKLPEKDKIILYDPKAWPFGPLSAHNMDDLFLDEKKWPTVINYVLTNTLTTPIYKLGLQFASIQPKSIVGAKKEERIAQIIQTVAGHEKRDLTEAEKQEIRDLVNWEEDMAAMNIYEKWHHFLYKERVDITYKALETAFKAKYDQDPIFAQTLHATDNRAIEYVSLNSILGTGPQEEYADGKPTWNGLNLLGVCLTQLRHRENLVRTYQAKQELESRQREAILNVWRAENILLHEIQNKTKAMDNLVFLSSMPFREAKLYYDSTGIERFLGKSAAEIVNTFPNLPDQPLLHDSIIRMYKRQKGPIAELYRNELITPGSLARHYYEKQQRENREKSHLQKMKDIIVMYTEYLIEQTHPEFSAEQVTKAAEQLEWTAPSVEAYNILRAKIIKLYKERALPVEILERISMFIGDDEKSEASEASDADEESKTQEEEEDRESTSSSSSSSSDPIKQMLGTEKDRRTHYANRLSQYTGRAAKKYKKWSEEKLKSALRHYEEADEEDDEKKNEFSDDELPEAQGEWIIFAKTGRGAGKIEIGRRAQKPTMSEIEDIVTKYNKKLKKQKPKITEDQIFFVADYPEKGTTTIEIRHADGTKEKFGEYSRTVREAGFVTRNISPIGFGVGDLVNIQRPGGPYKIRAISGSSITLFNTAGLELVVSPSEILSRKQKDEPIPLMDNLPERSEIVEEYNKGRKIKPSQVVVSWSESMGHLPFEYDDKVDIEEPEIVPIHGMPIKVYTSMAENESEVGIFSPVYEKDFKVDGLIYPTVAHYITTCLIAATGMKIDAKSKPAYTRGITMVEAYNLISAKIGHTLIPINDATQIWETRYAETFRDLLKELSRIALIKKFTHSGMQNLLLLTGDKEIIWGDKHDAFLGVGENKSGSNAIGKLMIEIRENLKKHIDTKSSLPLSKGGVPYMHVMSFFLQDPFMRNWLRRRVKEMVSMVNKLHTLAPEEELTPAFIDTVLREMYAPCNTVNSLKQVEFSTLPTREIPKKRKNDPVKVVPYMPREFVIIVDECNGLPAIEDTVFKAIEEKKQALAIEEQELDLELRLNLVKSMKKLEGEIKLSREEVLKKIEEMEGTAAFQKKNAAEQNKERAKVWRSMSKEVNTKLDKQAGKITHAVVDRKSIPQYQKKIEPLVQELLQLYKEQKGILEHRDRQYEEISIAYWERATASLFAIISLLENSDENDIRKLILGAEVLASEPSLCTNIGVELPDPMENCIASALVNILISINRFSEKYISPSRGQAKQIPASIDLNLAVSILLGKAVKKMPELNFTGDDPVPKKKKKDKKKDKKKEREEEDKESIATSIATSVATEDEIKDVDFDIEEALENREVEREVGNAYLEQRDLEAERAMEEREQEDPKNLYDMDYDNEFSTSKESNENENDMQEAAEFGFRRRTGHFGVRGHVRGAPTVELTPYLILIRQVLGEDDEYEVDYAKSLASAVKAVNGFKFMDEAIKRTRINFFATLR